MEIEWEEIKRDIEQENQIEEEISKFASIIAN